MGCQTKLPVLQLIYPDDENWESQEGERAAGWDTVREKEGVMREEVVADESEKDCV